MQICSVKRAIGLGVVASVALALRRPPNLGARLTVDPKASAAWWQINPHLNQLWATTCPADPGWLPGEAKSSGSGWGFDATALKGMPPKDATSDTIHIPLFPRTRVRLVCAEGVHGELVAPDTVTWKGASGTITVDAAALVTGEKFRDAFARDHVLETDKHPHITFTIDSVIGAARDSADSVHAVAVGTFELHGVRTPLSVPVVAWADGGGVRVRSRWYMSADDLWSKYGISKISLGLGVGMGIWRQLWMGIDAVLRPGPL
jgi:hypothetical protein